MTHMTSVQTGSTTALQVAVNEAALVVPKQGKTISQELEGRRDAIQQALGRLADTDYFIRTVVIETQRNPDLLKCTPASLMGSVMTAAQLRLDFGPLGLAYVLPRWSSKKTCYEAQFQVGYRGLISLARSSGDIKDIGAFPVYEKDIFRRWRDEHGEHLMHEPYLGEDRGPAVRYYGHAIFNGGGSVVRVMELSDIARHRAFSESANSKYSPWKTNELSMCLKTCIIAMKAFLPLQPKDAQRLAADEQIVEETREGDTIIHQIGPQSPTDGGPDAPVADARTGEILDVQEVEPRLQAEPEPQATETVPEPPVPGVAEILSELPEAAAGEAMNALLAEFTEFEDTDPEVLSYLHDWLDADPSTIPTEAGTEAVQPTLVPQDAPEAPKATGTDEPPWEPNQGNTGQPGGAPTLSDAQLTKVQKSIDTWSADVCKQKLSEWGQAPTGSVSAMRSKLLMVLAPEVAKGNPAATDLF